MMKIRFALEEHQGAGLCHFDEEALKANPALFETTRGEGPLSIQRDGEPKIVVFDELIAAVNNLCFVGISTLLRSPQAHTTYRYMTSGRTIQLERHGDWLSWSSVDETVRLCFASYVREMLQTGERLLELLREADHPVVPLLQEHRDAAHATLKIHPIGPTQSSGIVVVEDHSPHWDRCDYLGSHPDRARAFYIEVLGDRARRADFLQVSPMLSPPQWLGTLVVPRESAVWESADDHGVFPIQTLGAVEVWFGPGSCFLGLQESPSSTALQPHRRQLRALDPHSAAQILGDWLGPGVAPDAITQARSGEVPGWEFFFPVEDLAKAKARAMSAGAVVLRDEPERACSSLQDPWQAEFGLVQFNKVPR